MNGTHDITEHSDPMSDDDSRLDSGSSRSAPTCRISTRAARRVGGTNITADFQGHKAAACVCLVQQKKALNIPTCNLRGARMAAGVKRG